MTGQIITIAEGKLFALAHPYALDGRASSHPLNVRGFTTMNCFLLVEDDRALLISTGFSVHQDALLAQLEALVGDRPLSLVIPRVEFASMCNARPIADRFPVEVVYLRVPDSPSLHLNFRPEFSAGESDGDGLRRAELVAIKAAIPAPVDRVGRRPLEFLLPQLRLLPATWGYDAETRTLFTGDLFCWVWRESPEGPWELADGDDDPTTPERVETSLLRNRYWWLAGADTAPLRRALEELFDTYDIDVIAPDHGCILRGGAVDRHYQLLQDFLAAAPAQPSVGIAAAHWPTVGAR
jgi:hypothetical protein